MKYGNKKTVIDGVKFDSKKEAQRYLTLKQMQDDGIITQLECQPRFKLIDSQYFESIGKKERGIEYVADFSYKDKAGRTIVEDVKSAITAKDKAYRIKRKLMKYFYDIEILEV